jgi:uncharacterized protein (DUF1800 family)
MNRRQLFQNLMSLGQRDPFVLPHRLLVVGGAEEHTDPLTYEDVLHLLRRIGFGATMTQAKSYVGRTAGEVVDELLGTGTEPDPTPPGAWIDDWTEDPMGADLQTRNQIWNSWERYIGMLGEWWIDAMKNDPTATEKITLFWSSHWTSEFEFDNTFSLPQALYRQYLLLRRHRLGDLREMALEITVDSAMLYYLGGTYNSVGAPNENYARELLELFLTGLGWYTEGDVQEAARVLTGWRAQLYSDTPAPNEELPYHKDGRYKSWFDASNHDTGAKQFLGRTIPARTADNNTAYQVKHEEIGKLIDIIFDVRADAVSTFIADKMYRFFVYSAPSEVDPDFINEVAQIYRDANFNLRALLRAIFVSKHFYDPALRGCQIKTPIEFVATLMRQLDADATDPQGWTAQMDQRVMDPPNVAGWPGYRSWISTNTYPQRRLFTRTVINGMGDAKVNAFIKSFDDYGDVHKFVPNVVTFLLPVPVSQERIDYYKQALLQGAPDYDWPQILNDPAASASRMRNMLTTISRAPDFQLC